MQSATYVIQKTRKEMIQPFLICLYSNIVEWKSVNRKPLHELCKAQIVEVLTLLYSV